VGWYRRPKPWGPTERWICLVLSLVQAAGFTKPTVFEASSLAASLVAGAKLPAVPLAMSAPERPDAIIECCASRCARRPPAELAPSRLKLMSVTHILRGQ
jgi:hypothetical protein